MQKSVTAERAHWACLLNPRGERRRVNTEQRWSRETKNRISQNRRGPAACERGGRRRDVPKHRRTRAPPLYIDHRPFDFNTSLPYSEILKVKFFKMLKVKFLEC